MKKCLLSLLSVLALGGAFAEEEKPLPTSSFLSANHQAMVSVNDMGTVSSFDLTGPATAPDGGSWYGGSARTWINDGTRLTSSLTGYLASWHTYDVEPTSARDAGPLHMTRLLSPTNLLTLTAESISNLFVRPGTPSTTDLYVKFTPITYRLKYELGVGTFAEGGSHPDTATYDKSFVVSAPTRSYYTFAGWKVGGKLYFKGETADVTFVNLTAENGAEVAIGATWNAKPYPLQLSFGDGVTKIHYRVGNESDWLETSESLTVQVGYGETWSAWAEAAYGWTGSGTGWDPEGVTSGRMTEAGDKFKPQAQRRRFTVTAKASPTDGGSVSGSGVYEYEASASLTASPYTGYRFVGWSDGSTENPYTYPVVSNAVLTAFFKVRTYPLQLVVNEGVEKIHYRLMGPDEDTWSDWAEVTGTTTLDVVYETRYSVYADAKPGYRLTGSGSSLGSAVTGTVRTEGFIFAPEPTKGTYNVIATTSPSNGGETSVQPVGKLALGETAHVSVTAKAGYTFVQWNRYVGNVFEEDVSRNPEYAFEVTDNTSLVAILAKEAYTVTFVYRDVTGEKVRDSQQVAYNTSAVEPPAEKRNNWPGHAFSSWSTYDWQSVKGDMTVEAIYADGGYTVHFNANGGTGSMADQPFACGTAQALRKCTFVRTGYTFVGWSVDATSPSRQYADEESVKDLTTSASVTLYAVWEPITYTIRYSGGAGATGSMDDQTVRYDELVPLSPNEFKLDPHAFTGWKDGAGHSYADGEEVTRLSSTEGGIVELTACWDDFATVWFHGNGGVRQGDEKQTYSQPVEEGVETALRPNAFALPGYTFAGWDTNKTGTVAVYGERGVITNASAADLYAVWTPNTYTVIFDANGGSGKMSPKEMRYGENCEIKNTLTSPGDGWNFTGWSTNSLASVGSTVVSNLTTVANDHVRLYAIWKMECGKWSEALGCSNLAFKCDKSDGWIPTNHTGYTCLTNGTADAVRTLEAVVTGSGTLTFQWKASAVGDWNKYGVKETEAERRKNTKLVVFYNEAETSYWGNVSGDWQEVGLANIGQIVNWELKFTHNPTSGQHPCMLRNVRWEPSDPPCVTNIVTFDLSGGTRIGGGETRQEIVAKSGMSGEALEPTVSPPPGYRFVRWSTYGWTNVTADVEAKAEYALVDYTVTYLNTHGIEHKKITTFTRETETYAFAGLDAEGFSGWEPARIEKGTTSNLVVTAKWDKETYYTVTFDAGEQGRLAAGETNQVRVAKGKNAVAPEVVAETGYAFAGWDKSLDNVKASFTAKAQYTLLKYPITYANLKGATHANPSEYAVTSFRDGQGHWHDIALEEPKNGNANIDFVGWAGVDRAGEAHFLGNAIPLALTNGLQAIDLAAVWAYRVSWTRASGDHVTAIEGELSATAKRAECYVTEGVGATNAPAVTCERGYAFAGWRVVEPSDAESLRKIADAEGFLIDAAGRRVHGGSVVTNVTQAMTLAAVATANVYRVTYEGLEGATHANPETFTAEDAFAFTAPGARTGYYFAGWDPAGIVRGTSSNVTAVARWTTGATYQVEVTAEGAGEVWLRDGEGAVATNPGWYAEGTELVAWAKAAEGWLFAGWEEEGSSLTSGQETASPLAFTVRGPVAMTAVFTQKVHAVTIDGKVMEVGYGETMTVSTPASVTEGLTNRVCTGWVGTGDVPASGTSNRVSFAVTQASSLTWLYATNYWVEAACDVRRGTVEVRDGEGAVATNPGWFAEGTELVAEAKAAAGWLFAGWKEEGSSLTSGQETASPFAFTVRGPVAMTAVFTQRVHTVVFELDENLVRTGGGALEQAVGHGDAAALPTVEGVGYYDLVGWQLADATTRPDIDAEGYLVDASGRRVRAGAVTNVTEALRFVARSAEAAPHIAAAVAAEYETRVAIDPIAVRCVHEEDATLKVTGLPAGLKFTTKPVTQTVTAGGRRTVVTNVPANSIYGTPTKSGLFTASVTATLLRQTVATTNLAFVVRADGETVVRTEVSLADAVGTPRSQGTESVPGKTTGQGVYAPGKKVTLKATASRGYVFSGWWLGGEAASSRAASYALVVPEADVTYAARFVTSEQDAASVRASVDGWALFSDEEITAGGTPAPLDVATNVSVGVYLEWPVVHSADSAATVAVTGLPAGLKFTAKPVTQTVTVDGRRTVVTNVPANTIYGTPTAAGKTDRRGEIVPSAVKVTVTTAGKAKATGVIALTVEALPEALVGTYVGGADGEEADGSSSFRSDEDVASPLGSATVTLAKTGKISGKWISEGKTWTLAATGFDALVEGGADGVRALPAEGDRVYMAAVTFTCGKEVEAHPLAFSVNDLGYGTVVSGEATSSSLQQEDEPSASLLFSATYVPWKTDVVLKAVAAELRGAKFDVASDGGVTLAGTVGGAGTVSVKGTFETGAAKPHAATVSATLVPVDAEFAQFELFVWYPAVKNKFDGYATTLRLVWDGETLRAVAR